MVVKNSLKIRARAIDLKLSGDAVYVEDAYRAMRHVIMERFRETLHGLADGAASIEAVDEADRRDEPNPSQDRRQRKNTNPMFEAVARDNARGLPENTKDAAETPMQTVIVGDVYHNVTIVARRELDRSIFGRVLSARFVERFYVNGADKEQLSKHLSFSKTLWRELTSAGQSALERGGDKR